jgi:hypothetical protein
MIPSSTYIFSIPHSSPDTTDRGPATLSLDVQLVVSVIRSNICPLPYVFFRPLVSTSLYRLRDPSLFIVILCFEFAIFLHSV